MKEIHSTAAPTLLFVYNANSDLFSSLTDFAHKLLSPATYACNLCALTYGHFTQKLTWKNYLRSLAIPVTFLHKDEFEKKYTQQVSLPAIFLLHDNQDLEVFIDAKKLNELKTLTELQALIDLKLADRTNTLP